MWLAQIKSTLDRDSIWNKKFFSCFMPWTSIRQCREISITFFRDCYTHLRFHMLLLRSRSSLISANFHTFSDSINFHEACKLTWRCLTFHDCALVNGETINKEAALVQCVTTTSCGQQVFYKPWRMLQNFWFLCDFLVNAPQDLKKHFFLSLFIEK